MKKKALIIITGSEAIQQEVEVEIKSEKVNYQEKDGTNVLFDKKKKLLIRENQQFLMEFIFEKNIVSLYMKEERKEVEIPLITREVEIKENNIVIKYKLEEQEYSYEIRMEESS